MQLSKTKEFKNFIVSSESHKVLKIAKEYGFKTLLRNKYFSTSKVPMSEVYFHLGKQAFNKHVAWINVINPLVNAKIYDDAVNKFRKIKNQSDCFLSPIENRENFFKKVINFKRSPWPPSQNLKPLITLLFVINILRKEDLIKWGSSVSKNSYFLR